MDADRWSDLLALTAAVVGAVVLLLVWPRRRRVQLARLRHPSTPPPVVVTLDSAGLEPRWRLSTSESATPISIDIFTWHPTDTSLPWFSEPIIEPIALDPGTSVLLESNVVDATTSHDVVLAWTLHRPDGDLQGSRTLRVDPVPSAVLVEPVVAESRARSMLLICCVAMAAVLGALATVAAWRVAEGDRGVNSHSAIVTPTAPPTTISRATPTTTTTTTTTTMSSTTTTSTSSTTTSSATTTTSSSSTSTTIAPDPDGRIVSITARIGECRFAADCLIAGFTLVGFPSEGAYVCEFDDGSRFEFRYLGDGAEAACATSGDAITIEVDGVRSATATRESTG